MSQIYKKLIFVSAVLFVGAVYAGGNIEGQVTVKSKGLFGKDGAKGDASNVVIFLEELQQPNPNGKGQIVQKGKQFSPRVLPIVMGGVVEFPNDDPVFHNVFSVSGENRFDLDLYKRPKSGVARMICQSEWSMFCPWTCS